MKRFLLLLILLVAFAVVAPAFAQTTSAPVQQRKQGRRGGKHFRALDKNNDGQISRDEWTRKPKAFDRLDLNHDGVITKEEMQEVRQMRKGKR